MKKIVFVETVGYGLYNFRGGIIKKLCEDNYKVYIISPFFKEIKEMEKWGCEYIPIKIERLGINIFKDLKIISNLTKIYLKIKPDLIFHYSIKPNIYGGIAAQISKIKYVGVIPGAGRLFANSGFKKKIGTILYKIGLNKAEKIIFLNNEDMQEFINLKICNRKNTFNLKSEGVNISKFLPKQKKNIEKNKFLMISRVTKEKGVFYYLNAAKIIKEKYKDTEFYFLGGLGEISKNEFERKILDSKVKYLGVSDNVNLILEQMNCFILPSYYREGVPRTLLEAGAMEIPIITTDNIGCKDVVNNGVNGFICKIKNTNDLVDKIEKFIDLSLEEKIKMGKESRKKIIKEFNEKRIISDYYSIIKNME
ncbi:MAG: glycosyltransferase family 4 protein [Cetobacterium sp.]